MLLALCPDDVEGLCALMVLDNDGRNGSLLFPYEMSDKPVRMRHLAPRLFVPES